MFISERRTVFFGPTQGTGPREITDNVFLPRPVENIVTGLSGFSVSFVGAEEGRPFGQLVVELINTEAIGNAVEVTVKFGLRDLSGDWDDAYTGLIDYVIYAELQDDNEFGDAVTINALEYNQAIQFFRSYQDLDPPNQQPDNTVPRVAGKATAIRVYADFNPPDGIQDGDEYAGELEVESSQGSTVLTELFGYLIPGRDTKEMELNSGRVPHFVIPAKYCQGTITVRGRLRVNRPPGALETGWSPYFQTGLDFGNYVAPLVFLVGFNYLVHPGVNNCIVSMLN
jgi:hypothetical protein